jgi:uncharacterized membrane protein
MGIEKRLEVWRAHDLITAVQAVRIQQFEREQRTSARWVVWGLSSVGALAVAAGIISLVSANWRDIPDGVKLATGLTLLLGSLRAAYQLQGKAENWPRDLLLVLHQGLLLAMIGLITQVYHLPGNSWRTWALAATLAWPAAFAASRAIVTDVAIGFTFCALSLAFEELGLWRSLDDYRLWQLMLGGVTLLLVAAAAALSRVSSEFREGPVVALRRWAFWLGAMLMNAVAFEWHYANRQERWFFESERDMPLWPLAFFGVAALLAMVAQFDRKSSPARVIASILGLTAVTGSMLDVVPGGLVRQIVGFGLICTFLVSLIIVLAEQGDRRGVNFASFALAVRVVALFFELFEDLTRTGFGLIITGLLLVCTAWAWWRLRALVPIAAPKTASPLGGVS